MKITLIAGARPNFMKIAPILRALDFSIQKGNTLSYRLVHTGQHYDDALSKIFFDQLGIPSPDINLGAGQGSQAEQTAKIMIEFEKDLIQNPTDLVIVVGDVTSTMACTIVAKKLNTKVAHVEGGIRSFDMTMPEEVNRIVTDSLSDYFFTTSEIANQNLLKTGVRQKRIFFVGNTMIDTLLYNINRLKKPVFWDQLNLSENGYFVLTLHRPSNVDDFRRFEVLLNGINKSTKRPVIFPIHPRTKRNFDQLEPKPILIYPCDPLGYLEFVYLVKHAKGVITDSGGVQEETTVLGIPCLTLRNNTERPETVSVGTNVIIGDNLDLLRVELGKIESGNTSKGRIPENWDGNAATRIVECLNQILN